MLPKNLPLQKNGGAKRRHSLSKIDGAGQTPAPSKKIYKKPTAPPSNTLIPAIAIG